MSLMYVSIEKGNRHEGVPQHNTEYTISCLGGTLTLRALLITELEVR